jgi:polyisoprenyl-phosphate glycosyltransferase
MQEIEKRVAFDEQQRTDAPVLSVVVPVFNEVETLPHLYTRLTAVLQGIAVPYEIVLVNDGSKDGSLKVMSEFVTQDGHVRVVDFSRNFGHQPAVSAGMAHARGQAVVLMDADLQDPPEVIPELFAQWRAGAEVVYAQRMQRNGETFFKLATAAMFYRLLRRITSVDIPRDTGDFRLMDRRVVDTLNALPEHRRFMRGLAAWVGFRQVAVPYERHERFAGQTKYPLSKMIRFAMDAITGFSYIPLQLASRFGFFLTILSFLGIIAVAVLRFTMGVVIGQATTISLVLFLGGVQLIFLGIIGEYLGRIYDEVRSRPNYIVRQVIEQRDPSA